MKNQWRIGKMKFSMRLWNDVRLFDLFVTDDVMDCVNCESLRGKWHDEILFISKMENLLKTHELKWQWYFMGNEHERTNSIVNNNNNNNKHVIYQNLSNKT